MTPFDKARTFIHRNARPLELALWQYHFEGGSAERVLHALRFYQNDDGGFGHGIEADFLNPNSNPIATWAASVILLEIDAPREHPIVQGVLRYLDSGADFNCAHQQWLNVVPTNNDHPHAIWWTWNGGSDFRYNPTAALAGFILRYADAASQLHAKAQTIARSAVDWFCSQADMAEQHIVGCFIQLHTILTVLDNPDAKRLGAHLSGAVFRSVCTDESKWGVDYVSRPSDFLLSRESPWYPVIADAAEAEVHFLITSQGDDGAWPVPWQWWTPYKEFEVSANWWKSHIVIKHIRYLAGFHAL